MAYSSFGILAVLILFIVNQDILFRRASFAKPAWNVYRRFLYAVLVYYVTDILWGLLESRKLATALFADTEVYFFAMAAGVMFWTEYTVAYLEKKDAFGRFLLWAGRILAGVIAVLAAVNIFVPVLFTVDSASVYHELPLRNIMLSCQILLLLIISIYAFFSMPRQGTAEGTRRRYLILASFGLVMAVFLFFQLWYPYWPLYTIAYMLGTSMLHSFVANDEKEAYRQELQEAEKITELKENIASLLDNMPALTFTKDAKTGVYLACNQAFAEYANRESPEGVIGLTDAEIFDPETAAHFVQDDKIALSLTGPYAFYEDVPDAAGRQHQFQTTKTRYTDTMGRLCVLGMCQDVTDLVRVQHESAATKEAYENAVSAGLLYTRIAQTLARDYTDMFSVNIDTEEYIEYRRGQEGAALTEARRGWHFFSDCLAELTYSVWPDDRESFRQAMTRKTLMKALSMKDTFIMAYRQTSKNGPVYVSMKVSRLEDDEHFIIIAITNVDAEMRDAMAKSEALAEALSSAEEANKARNAFLSGMSHEIRTPMNVIIGLDTLALKKKDLDPETLEYLEKVGESGRHLLNLINDILDMSRIESGHIALRKDEFPLSALLEEIGSQIRPQCEKKGLTYDQQILGPVDEGYISDETKLREALVNILSNAVKFTDAPGNVTLTVERVQAFEDQSTLRFRVRDTGIGMDPEYLPKVFEPFSQEDSTNRNKYGGTGLGLAITKRIVEIMNGSITVESEKGVGTVFTVTVTLKTCAPGSLGQAAALDPKDLYVLVVDDEPIEADHARMILEEAGIRTDACTSGQEALRLMEAQHEKRRPYNLVLMDWNMPGMSGLEASAEIHRQFEGESTVVVLTAYSWDEIQEEARRVGVDNFLSKPLTAAGLISELERISRRSGHALFREKKRANLTGRRILLAEDLESNAEIMTDILEMENIRTDHALNGRFAVQMFRDSKPGTYAAILMDIRMPEMDGLEATAAIRALPRKDAKNIPIIALTANAFDEDVQRSMQAGMNAHLSKPVDSDHLIRLLGELVYESEEK